MSVNKLVERNGPGRRHDDHHNKPVDRNGPGRREDDRQKCVFHDFLEDRNLSCFDVIKGSLGKLETKLNDHMLDAGKSMLDHEKTQDNVLRNYVTKWTLIIFVGIATTAFGIIMGLVSNQISETHRDVKTIATDIHGLSNDLTRYRAIQEGLTDRQIRFQRYIDDQDRKPR